MELVCMGTSWGGLDAVGRVLADLDERLPCAVVVVQHRGVQPSALDALLRRRSRLHVREPQDKEPIDAGVVYVAPADYHLYVERGRLTLDTDPPFRHSRPSIDVTFESAADAYGPAAIGVVLTGANQDGAEGLARIVARGGVALVQDPATAARQEMPLAAIAAVPGARVVPLAALGAAINQLGSPLGAEATG